MFYLAHLNTLKGKIMQNKPNFRNDKTTVNFVKTTINNKKLRSADFQNKPKQTQSLLERPSCKHLFGFSQVSSIMLFQSIEKPEWRTVMSKKLYVGNISPEADEASLNALFSMFGTVERAYIITDRETGKSKGYGFVVMDSEEDAMAAITALNGKDCGGYTVKVNEAKSK